MCIACGRHADDRCDNVPWCMASVLVWRILFPSNIVAGMLQDSFVSTTVHTKAKNAHRLRPARRRSSRQSAQVQCFGARLENFVSVGYCCRHAARFTKSQVVSTTVESVLQQMLQTQAGAAYHTRWHMTHNPPYVHCQCGVGVRTGYPILSWLFNE
jgi:hypothetical protein